MSDARHRADPSATGNTGTAGAGLGLMLACFEGTTTAAKTRSELADQIHAAGGVIVDEVILRVDAKGNTLAYNRRRTIAGALTPALTWGVFALLAGGGVDGLVTWAVIAAIGGGLIGYFLEHTLTKHELASIGEHLRPGSSAVTAFVRTDEPEAILRAMTAHNTTAASVAIIGSDLSARVWSAGASKVETSSNSALVSMVMARYPGHDTVGAVAERLRLDHGLQVELLFSVDKNGRKRVRSPLTGVGAVAKSSAPWWAAFGLVAGFAAGWSGDGGVLSALEDGLVTALAWGVFGLGAGALYGLWAGRAISARRMKGLGALLPPDSSAMLAWADGVVADKAKSELSKSGAETLVIRCSTLGRGLVLEASQP